MNNLDKTKENFSQNIIFGRNSVFEALKSNQPIDSVLVAGKIAGSIVPIVNLAKEKNILIKETDKKKLDFLTENKNHQNIAAVAAAKEYSTVEDILAVAKKKNEPPFIVILDEIEDPHNLGAIIRTAECAGVHGIIIPKHRSAGVTGLVAKTSAGALHHIHIAKVTNISVQIKNLQKNGIWVFGADMAGKDYKQCNLSGPVALVIGNEGKGISRLVKESCDDIISLPMNGNVNSLNASVAAGILIYQILSSR